ncbi:FAD-dependent oxidoreductase [Bryobacter aggregatus]|uniref:FAD-dependent oxidoreductase n=1 Tax=Bryobacter aggregatus TaxID=360054 RepID=UPI0004E0DCFD|nr:FAD-dependent oxidoreductase [Bryobacter aggregatus]
MPKPFLLTVDDDPAVLRAIERDLRNHYAASYRILRADSGKAALELLEQLAERKEDLALILADQRMPEMDGVQFLVKAREIFPDARRVLLTAYADNSAAIAAINDVRLHHYLMKPWDPPEQNLYPVLDDLLNDWKAEYEPPFRGIKVIGQRWSPEAHRIKDFLGRHHVPFRWVDVAEAERDPAFMGFLTDKKKLPLLVFADNTCEDCPASEALAERLGLHMRADTQFYDLVIVGGGPAGLAAAVYGASEGLKTLMIDREAPGGQAALSSRIENYLGFPAGLSGGDLARRAVAQARKFGVEILAPQECVQLRTDGEYRYLKMADGAEVAGSAVLLSTGLSWRRLNVPNMDRLTGAGVYYGAATTEAPSCQGEEVYVIGGANSAGQAAMHFSNYAKKVIMLVRGDGLSATMSKYLIDQIAATPNIEVISHTEVVGVEGKDQLEWMTLANRQTNEEHRVPASLLFIFIGAQPCTDWLQGTLCLDDHGFVRTGPMLKKDGQVTQRWPLTREPMLLETSMPGVFAAGDTRSGSVKRVASSVGEGSVVVQFVHHFLAGV